MKSLSAGMPEARYEFTGNSRFVVHNYHSAKPFSNFLPGVAGVWGIPLWAFFVNRGQGIACFGIKDKDHSMMEFQSANLHHRRVGLEGFRTFLKVRKGADVVFYEPFKMYNPEYRIANRLIQTDCDLGFEEENETLELAVKVNYFTIPGESFAALSRSVTIENRSAADVEIELIDGFPNVVPYGVNYYALKYMPFITDGYLDLKNLEEKVPYYTIGNVPGDESETAFVTEGNFYFSFYENKGRIVRARPVIDPALVFGDHNDRVLPYRFLNDTVFEIPAFQNRICQTASAFSHAIWNLPANSTRSLYSAAGSARTPQAALDIADSVSSPEYVKRKSEENRATIAGIKDVFFIQGGEPMLDAFAQQSFLDNTLRGGLPLTLPSKNKKHVLHVFARKHGDLERDYNFFQLEPQLFSQGNGNFRDVNQNRRNDVWFNTDVGDSNLKLFFSLIQPDGFNPLLIEGARFGAAREDVLSSGVLGCIDQSFRGALGDFLEKSFTLGSLFAFLAEKKIALSCGREEFLERILSISEKHEDALHGHGYWSDHWLYNFDLLQSYCAIFPENLRELLLEDRTYTYRDTDVFVLPRAEKYVINCNGDVRHLQSIAVDSEKTRRIASRTTDRYAVRTGNGEGTVYYSNLLGKIVCLIVNKMATLSPSGMGIEMDGGRPGWCDSVNGIPSLFAAGTPEVCQLVRGIRMVRAMLDNVENWKQPVFAELYEFYRVVLDALIKYRESADMEYWDRTASAKQAYRVLVRAGISGKEEMLGIDELREFLDLSERHLCRSLDRSLDGDLLPVTYITHDAIEYEKIMDHDPASGMLVPKMNKGGMQCVKVNKFKPHFFAPFLEGIVYRMAIETDQSKKVELWNRVRSSRLFDEKLKMYKIDADLDLESKEQGRTGGWAKGWFENESIFSHVEFKYLLQCLRSKLYDQFFEDIRTTLPPFLDMAIYARSPVENVSFMVSSAHDREQFHGRGMQPRLSGTNAEMVHMMLVMSFGEKPFRMQGDQLVFGLNPVLPSWMFTEKEIRRTVQLAAGKTELVVIPANSFCAMFLGKTLIIYHNPHGSDTFGVGGVKPARYRCTETNGSMQEFTGEAISGTCAIAIRNGQMKTIEIELA